MFTENQWMDRQEAICEEFASGAIDFEEALSALCRIGFDTYEAETLLQEWVH